MDEAPEDAALFIKAVGEIAWAHGMIQLARDTGITRGGRKVAKNQTRTASIARDVQQRPCSTFRFELLTTSLTGQYSV